MHIELIEKEITGDIIGAFFEVYNTLGYGFPEFVYSLAMERELVDRFGPLPPSARNLIWVVRLRLLATQSGVGAVQTEEAALVIRLLPGRELERAAVARKLPSTSSVTSHMVRLDRMTLGEGWREGLVRAIVAVGETVRVA